MPAGRFAPSPTGDLHLGNLRTALLAWLFARATDSRFIVRMEDLDPVQSSVAHERSQLADLAALGLDWDGDIVRQSERFDRYEEALSTLDAAGLTFACYCTRKEIREAASAPHDGALPAGAYPGTCRDLTRSERVERESVGRPPAVRLRSPGIVVTVDDVLLGSISAVVDDVVLRRNDGVPAYNLAVVVDDAAQGVEQVVRGSDLADSSPRQRYLAELLALPPVSYAHVPLVLASDGNRLAKRNGAVTLADQRALGRTPAQVRALLASSLGLAEPGETPTMAALSDRFAPDALPKVDWLVPDELVAP